MLPGGLRRFEIERVARARASFVKRLGILAIPATLALLGCAAEVHPATDAGPHGTIAGTVRFWQGDFMPPGMSGTITPVARTVVVFDAAHVPRDVAAGIDGASFTAVNTTRRATTTSDSNGRYRIDMPAGAYSVFVMERSQFYANSGDGYGVIGAVTVRDGETAQHDIDIQWSASF